jgi:hypothetical protein
MSLKREFGEVVKVLDGLLVARRVSIPLVSILVSGF